MIFLSDGRFTTSPAREAAEARGRGIQIFAVAYGSGIERPTHVGSRRLSVALLRSSGS